MRNNSSSFHVIFLILGILTACGGQTRTEAPEPEPKAGVVTKVVSPIHCEPARMDEEVVDAVRHLLEGIAEVVAVIGEAFYDVSRPFVLSIPKPRN